MIVEAVSVKALEIDFITEMRGVKCKVLRASIIVGYRWRGGVKRREERIKALL